MFSSDIFTLGQVLMTKSQGLKSWLRVLRVLGGAVNYEPQCMVIRLDHLLGNPKSGIFRPFL